MQNLITATECGLMVLAVEYYSCCCAHSYTLSSSRELHIDEVEGAEITHQSRKNTAHTEYSKNIMSRAINEETEKFVLTSNQTKDQRGLGKIADAKLCLFQLLYSFSFAKICIQLWLRGEKMKLKWR